MSSTYLSLLFGVLALYAGAEILLRGSTKLALSLGIPRLVVGIVLVGMGTSMPELVSSLVALLHNNAGDIALGNVIGSNIANTALIMGAACVLYPVEITEEARGREVFWTFVVVIALIAAMMAGRFTRITGIVFLGILGAYLTHQMLVAHRYRQSGGIRPHPEGIVGWLREGSKDMVLIAIGMALLIAGGRYLVDSAIVIAESFGVSQRVIALTVVAFGTSCPELATALVASFRRSHDVSLGNILGSNVFNILAILGICSLVTPFTFSPRLLTIDLPVMVVLYLTLALIVQSRQRIGRVIGSGLLLAYFSYLIAIVSM